MSDTRPLLPTERMTSDEFLEWAEREQPGRVELIDGNVVPKDFDPETGMASETQRHSLVKGNAYSAFRAALRGGPCRAHVDGVSVGIAENQTFIPDVLVDCAPEASLSALTAEHPTIAVEVLSKSTRARDLSIKLQGYFSVPSLQHYLIVDAESRRVILHSRAGEGIATSIHSGGRVDFDPPGCSVNLDTFWEDLPA